MRVRGQVRVRVRVRARVRARARARVRARVKIEKLEVSCSEKPPERQVSSHGDAPCTLRCSKSSLLSSVPSFVKLR